MFSMNWSLDYVERTEGHIFMSEWKIKDLMPKIKDVDELKLYIKFNRPKLTVYNEKDGVILMSKETLAKNMHKSLEELI